MPRKFEERTIVISCDEDRASCKAAMAAKIPIVNTEFILTGILRQQVDTELYPFIALIG